MTRQPTRKFTKRKTKLRKKSNVRRASKLHYPSVKQELLQLRKNKKKVAIFEEEAPKKVKFDIPQVWIDKENDLDVEGGWGVLQHMMKNMKGQKMDAKDYQGFLDNFNQENKKLKGLAKRNPKKKTVFDLLAKDNLSNMVQKKQNIPKIGVFHPSHLKPRPVHDGIGKIEKSQNLSVKEEHQELMSIGTFGDSKDTHPQNDNLMSFRHILLKTDGKNNQGLNSLRSQENGQKTHTLTIGGFSSAQKAKPSQSLLKSALKPSSSRKKLDNFDSSDDENSNQDTIRLRRKSINPENTPQEVPQTPQMSANFGIKELLASSLKVQVNREKERRKSQTREQFGFQDIEKKIRFNSSVDKRLRRSPSEMKFMKVVPKKQFGRIRSSSFHKATHKIQEEYGSEISMNSMTLEEASGQLKSSPRKKLNPIYSQIHLMHSMDKNTFLDLTYELILESKGLKGRRLLRRKSCDTKMFGGKLNRRVELNKVEDSPYDLLYYHYVIEQTKLLGLKNSGQIKLPWYLQRKGLFSRMNALRMVIQNIALRKQIHHYKQDHNSKKGSRQNIPSPHRNSLAIKFKKSVNRLSQVSDMIDLFKFKSILEFCLVEKLTSVSETEERINQNIIKSQYIEPTKTSEILSKFKKAVYVAFRLITEHKGSLHSIQDIKYSIKKYLQDGSRKRVIRRFRQKKMVTRINNKLSLTQGLVFNVINTDKKVKFSQIRLSDEATNIIRGLLHENENQDNLRKLIAENKKKYLEQQKLEKEQKDKKKKFRNRVKGLIRAKNRFSKSHKSINDLSNPPSLKELALLTNPNFQRPKISKQVSMADMSQIRLNRLRSNTVLDIDDHLNFTKSGKILNRLNKIGRSDSKAQKNGEMDEEPTQNTGYSKGHKRTNSNPFLGIVARDLNINNNQHRYSTLKKGHNRSKSNLTNLLTSGQKSSFIIKSSSKKRLNSFHSRSNIFHASKQSATRKSKKKSKAQSRQHDQMNLLPYSEIQGYDLLK